MVPGDITEALPSAHLDHRGRAELVCLLPFQVALMPFLHAKSDKKKSSSSGNRPRRVFRAY